MVRDRSACLYKGAISSHSVTAAGVDIVSTLFPAVIYIASTSVLQIHVTSSTLNL